MEAFRPHRESAPLARRFGRAGSSVPRRPGERGAVIVEFTLVCLVFLGLLVGASEFGRAWYTVHMLSSAAREGARVGALMGGGGDREAAIRARIGEVLEPAGMAEYEVRIQLSDGYGQPLKVEVESVFESVASQLEMIGLDEPLRLKGSAVFNQEIP